MTNMFFQCPSLTTLDIYNFSTNQVEDMSLMLSNV